MTSQMMKAPATRAASRRILSRATALCGTCLCVLVLTPSTGLAGGATFNGHAGTAIVTTTAGGQRVQLGLNKSIVIDLREDAYDILVANPAVADAVTRTSRRIYLFGKAVGETNIFVFGRNGEQIANIDIAVERDVAGLEEHLRRFIPNSDIKVELINDNVVLTGIVETPLDAARAAQLATIFVSGGEATTGQFSQSIAAGGDGGVAINNPDEARRVSQIVNLLKIIGEDQVTLKVTVAEVSRNVMKQLGVNMIGSGNIDGITWGALSETVPGLGSPILPSQLGIATSVLDAYINAMEQSGVMKTLAEPTLTAVSGEKATFRVGGEFNLVTNQSVGDNNGLTYTIEKLEYGIGLEFQPVVLSAGRISLKVRTQVSEPTNEASVSLSGGAGRAGGLLPLRQPGMTALSIRKRLADTTVELPSGGSMMIAGLVRDDVRQAVQGIPGLAKVPVLGTLFRSRDFVRNETELVIIITPYLSRPVARNELARPDDNFNPTSDGAAIFLGRVNRLYGTKGVAAPSGGYHGVVGYIYK